MSEFRFVGGPFDGRLVDTGGAYEWAFPVRVPVTVGVSDGRWELPPVETYYRVGNVYRWEGLVEDAWADVDVSRQVRAESPAPMVRRELRLMLRRALEELAADKTLGRIVWRVLDDPRRTHVQTIRAFVGPRAPEFAAGFRAQRRGVRT